MNANFGFRPPVVPGDYNGRSAVDISGYVTWRKQIGSSGPSLPADGDHDTDVDAGDYAVWRENFGNYLDDYGNDALGASETDVPSKSYGVINVTQDTDWFKFEAAANTTYRLQLTRGTLDTAVLRLFGRTAARKYRATVLLHRSFSGPLLPTEHILRRCKASMVYQPALTRWILSSILPAATRRMRLPSAVPSVTARDRRGWRSRLVQVHRNVWHFLRCSRPIRNACECHHSRFGHEWHH